MKELRLLKANEIDVRIGTINEKGATLLLYKDARVDMNILDESGVKWKRSHELINGNLFCTISIWDDEIKEWISRQDVGVESNTEKEKGQASDAFKRAGFNFGIGRELYTAPFTWISSDTYTSFKNPATGKLGTYDKFGVTKIGYDENKEINVLEISNLKSKRNVFKLGFVAPVEKIAQRTDNTNTAEPFGDDTLARAKLDINEELVKQNYVTPADKKAFITFAIGKATIDNLDDAHAVAEALEGNDEGV